MCPGSHGDAVSQLLLVTHTDLTGNRNYWNALMTRDNALLTWLLVSTLALTAASLSRAYLQPMAKVEPPPTVQDPVMPVSRAALFFR